MPKQIPVKRGVYIGWTALPMVFAAALALLCSLPRIRESRVLVLSDGLAAVVVFAFAWMLRRHCVAQKRALSVEFVPRANHYVQMVMHACIYTYWGMYWPEVARHVPLLLAQVLFAYSLDMLMAWSRRGRWSAGFGPIPIILSTNLFLWFRDDWFFLQFAMISIGVIGKEYLRWKRDGRSTHIFNPSAVGLSVFSVILIATNSTGITWGEQIAATLHRPPNIYLEIFVLGLVVQGLFAVTLVTLAAASSLLLLNAIYTGATGVYWFIDAGIPVSVFLGLHLLVTDPSTSPRSKSGKLIFGGLYGCCVFGLYGVLSLLGVPRFYDKLLCVPPLNLSVRLLDRVGDKMDARFSALWAKMRGVRFPLKLSPQRVNLAFMAMWVIVFGYMIGTGFLPTEVMGKQHPGADPAFWAGACSAHKRNACEVWVGVLNAQCEQGSGEACATMGEVTDRGVVVPREPVAAAHGLGRACDLGSKEACVRFTRFVENGGASTLRETCGRGDAMNCFYLGTVLHLGTGAVQDDEDALRSFEAACKDGFVRACGVLGEMYLAGQGTAVDPRRALVNFDRSCAGQFGESCAAAGMLFHRGSAGVQDEAMSQKRFAQGCALGYRPACAYVQGEGFTDAALR